MYPPIGLDTSNEQMADQYWRGKGCKILKIGRKEHIFVEHPVQCPYQMLVSLWKDDSVSWYL